MGGRPDFRLSRPVIIRRKPPQGLPVHIPDTPHTREHIHRAPILQPFFQVVMRGPRFLALPSPGLGTNRRQDSLRFLLAQR